MTEKFYTKVESYIQATESNDLTRLIDVENLIDTAIQGVFKAPVRVVLDKDLTELIETDTVTYSSDFKKLEITGTFGIGFIIDGITLPLNSRILLANQNNKFENGIYVFSYTNGDDLYTEMTLTRANDFDTTSDLYSNVKVSVISGTTYDNTIWQLITDDPSIGNDTSNNLEFILIKQVSDTSTTITRLYADLNFIASENPNYNNLKDATSFAITHDLNDELVSTRIYERIEKQNDSSRWKEVIWKVENYDSSKIIVSIENFQDIDNKVFKVIIDGIKDFKSTTLSSLEVSKIN
jgi:hypothetical protein